MIETKTDPRVVLNPIERIKTREAWQKLNTGLSLQIGQAQPDIALELAWFMSDLNIELHRKFGLLEK